MLCITLTEPWASLVACGAKQIETRSWGTYYRGPIAVHASRKMTGADLDFAMKTLEVRTALEAAGRHVDGDRPKVKDAFSDTRGCVIAVARITHCFLTRDAIRTRRLWGPYQGEVMLSATELRFGNFEPGRYAWILSDVRKLDTPIPATGALGLWEWQEPADLQTEAA